MGAMAKFTLRDHEGFTLIELLAVMAIVAVLAGIVSVSVGGFGETSRDTQTRQDATTVERAAADFSSAQVAAESLRSKTVTVLDQDNIEQITGSRWPEDYISNAYAAVFPEDDLTTVASILFLDKDGTLSDRRPRGLLQRFNAIDFNTLLDGEFLAAPPDNANRTSEGFSDYLWLFEKATAAGGSSERASRKVAVFKLISVEKSETSNLVDLTYRRLVGGGFSDELLVTSDLVVTTDEDTPTAITLAGVDLDTCELIFVIKSGPTDGILSSIINDPCVSGDPNRDRANVTYAPNLNFNGEDSFTYTVIDGNGDDIATVTVTINVVNDRPVILSTLDDFEVDEDVPDTVINLSSAFTDVDIVTNADSLTFSVSVNPILSPVSATIEGTGSDSELRLRYLTDQNGFADITVQATDKGGLIAEQEFRVTVNAVTDPPSFTVGLDQTVDQDSGPQTVTNWATNISTGAANEQQGLTFILGTNALFSVQPAVSSTGTLTYTPVPDATGSATITVELQDNGTGSLKSASLSFTIDVTKNIFNDNGQALGSSQSNAVSLGDLDGDGDLDAFVSNGTNADQPNRIWLNDGNGTFNDSGQTLGSNRSQSVKLGDLDNDGDLDAFVANNFNQGTQQFGGPNKVWLNSTVIDPFGNGSFEDGLSFWNIDSGSVDLIHASGWPASNGQWSIDLNGGGPGTISQTFDTVVGSQYEVLFDMAGNTHCHDVDVLVRDCTMDLQVSAAGQSAPHSYDASATSTTGNFGWVAKSLIFTASSTTTTTLTFTSLTFDGDTRDGPALDNVRVNLS